MKYFKVKLKKNKKFNSQRENYHNIKICRTKIDNKKYIELYFEKQKT